MAIGGKGGGHINKTGKHSFTVTERVSCWSREYNKAFASGVEYLELCPSLCMYIIVYIYIIVK